MDQLPISFFSRGTFCPTPPFSWLPLVAAAGVLASVQLPPPVPQA